MFHRGWRTRLHKAVQRSDLRYRFQLRLPGRFDRRGRTAKLRVRTTRVVLDMVEAPTKERYPLEVNVVDVCEYAATAKNDKPIYWRLLTSHDLTDLDAVRRVVAGYAQRWKVEDFHRAWKAGACRVEDTQLRTSNRVIRWAVILAAVATRIERLKGLARVNDHRSARDEFTDYEIQAVELLRKRVSGGVAGELGDPVARWIAELGGYTGASSGGPLGAVTIRRGLETTPPVAAVLEQLDTDEYSR